jgi:hypothetical protein
VKSSKFLTIFTSKFPLNESLHPLSSFKEDRMKNYSKTTENLKEIPKVSVSRDSIINASNTAKQMIVVKTSQNIIHWSKSTHIF